MVHLQWGVLLTKGDLPWRHGCNLCTVRSATLEELCLSAYPRKSVLHRTAASGQYRPVGLPKKNARWSDLTNRPSTCLEHLAHIKEGQAMKHGLRVCNRNSRGHAMKGGVQVPNPNSRGHTTKRVVQVPNPNSRGHTTKRGVQVPNPNSRGHATRRGLRVSDPNSRGHAKKRGVRVPNPHSSGHAM